MSIWQEKYGDGDRGIWACDPVGYAYLSDLPHLYSPSRSLRSSADIRLLKIPLYKCKTKGDRAFSYSGPYAWKSLPLHIRNAATIDNFKSALKNLSSTSKILISSYLPDLLCINV